MAINGFILGGIFSLNIGATLIPIAWGVNI
jgi:hypothetical protein